MIFFFFFFFKQKTAYEMRISDWSSDVCSSDLEQGVMLAPIDHVEDKVDGKDEQVADHEEPHTRFAGQMCRRRRNVADRVRIRGGGEIGRAACRGRVCKYV